MHHFNLLLTADQMLRWRKNRAAWHVRNRTAPNLLYIRDDHEALASYIAAGVEILQMDAFENLLDEMRMRRDPPLDCYGPPADGGRGKATTR